MPIGNSDVTVPPDADVAGPDEATARRAALSRTARRDALLASDLFRALAPADLDRILAHTTLRHVPRATMLLRKGDAATAMHIIISGRARVVSTLPDGREVLLAMAGPGEVLGEIALLDGAPHSADVVAIEDCVMLRVDRAAFLRVIEADAPLCLRLMHVLCARLRRSSTVVEELALLDLPGRLGSVLLRLARDYGRPVEAGIRIGLKLSQKDLGSLIGASREKVNRQLGRWEDAGVIGFDGGHLVLRDAARLAAAGEDATP